MHMVRCTECGETVASGVKVCPGCGADPALKLRQLTTGPSSSLSPARPEAHWSIILIVGLAALFFVFKLLGSSDEPPAPPELDQSTRQSIWIERGKEAVRSQLKDGKSAEFKDVFFSKGQGDVPMTCGSVNAKNSFGGYAGYERFVSAGDAQNTFLESEVADFDVVWSSMCTAG